MKILHCKDLVTGCGEIFRGESEEDVLEKAAEHSKNVIKGFSRRSSPCYLQVCPICAFAA